MSEPEDIPGLPDDVQALLKAAEAGAPPPPPGIEAAVLAKVTATVAAPAAAAATVAAGAAAPVAIAAKPLVMALVGAVLATTVVGGVYLTSTRATDDSVPAPVQVPVEPPPPPVETAPVEAAPAETAPAETAPVEAPPVEAPPVEAPPVEKPVPKPAQDPALEGELLEAARDALSRGDGDVALKKLQEHASRFPRGQLVEERRALTVVAYAQRGDLERARATARAFEREYPSSLFLQTVRAATEEAP